jgi:hypothetical protein
MKELDKSGLEFVKMDAKKKIMKIEQKQVQKKGNNAIQNELAANDSLEDEEEQVDENGSESDY